MGHTANNMICGCFRKWDIHGYAASYGHQLIEKVMINHWDLRAHCLQNYGGFLPAGPQEIIRSYHIKVWTRVDIYRHVVDWSIARTQHTNYRHKKTGGNVSREQSQTLSATAHRTSQTTSNSSPRQKENTRLSLRGPLWATLWTIGFPHWKWLTGDDLCISGEPWLKETPYWPRRLW